MSEASPRIFISHSSKDGKVVQAFVEKILKIGLGLEDINIFCTSLVGTNIRSGEDFKRAIQKELQLCTAVIQIITKDYKESEVCLNEMGAAWILDKPVIPFILDPIRFNTVGFIHITDQILKLNDASDLHKFRDDHEEIVGRKPFKSAVYHRQINEFLETVKQNSNSYY